MTFADPAGGLSVAGGASVIPVLNEQVARARAAGARVVVHAGLASCSSRHTSPRTVASGGSSCVAGSWGAAAPSRSDRPTARWCARARGGEDGYSGFTMRDPVSGCEVGDGARPVCSARRAMCVASSWGGLVIDYCVRGDGTRCATPGYPTVLLTDAIAAVDLVVVMASEPSRTWSRPAWSPPRPDQGRSTGVASSVGSTVASTGASTGGRPSKPRSATSYSVSRSPAPGSSQVLASTRKR